MASSTFSIKSMFSKLSSKFWSEYIWLPPNITWTTYQQKTNGVEYAQFNDIYYSFYTSIFIFIIRFTLERYLFRPIGIKMGVKDRRPQPPSANPILEEAYRSNSKLGPSEIEGLARKTDMSDRDVEKWLKRRKFMDKPTCLIRFSESSWRCSFYTFIFLYGLWALFDKPWIYDSTYCIRDYPHHSVTPEIWWYYNIELGFYLSLMMSQFFDVRLNDFWQMFIHHIATVLLLCFSWACNLHRIGSLVLMIHDFADIPMEGAKITRYLKTPRLSSLVFFIFVVCWVVSRLYFLPVRVIYYSAFYTLSMFPMFPAYYIFNGLLCILQILHVWWTFLIARIAYNAIFVDGVRDLRESDDEYDSD